MRRGARTGDGVRRCRLSRQSVVPHSLGDVHRDVEPDGRLRIMRALQGDAVLRGSHDNESRSQDHREMATMGIERREATPQFISNFEACENDRPKDFSGSSEESVGQFRLWELPK